MKTKFYDEQKLEGNFIELPYGTYRAFQINVLPNGIKSLDIPAHAMVTLYSQDNFVGPRYIISNTGKKNLKVAGFEEVYPYTVQSVKIECACKIDVNPSVDLLIKKGDFKRNNNSLVAYTFYQVIPEPLTDPLDAPSPYNPTILIIPDFGTDKTIWECVQDKLAQKRFSSIVLDLRGVGISQPALSVKYADLIQDYRYIAQQLGQYSKKPILIGHGIGGAIAQLWALTYKFELRSLILMDTAPFSVYNSYNTLSTSITNWINTTITTDVFATNVTNAVYNTASLDCQPDKLKLDLYNSIVAADTLTLQRLFLNNPDDTTLALAPKYIMIPTLIIHGNQDTVIPEVAATALTNLIKGSKVRKIPTGHSPMFTYPDLTFDAIYKFLSPSGKIYIDPIPNNVGQV
ncbi:alpha/beta hydrolase family protein [Fadolivirus algeromassiliense]|jgi:pimeloyl-ACP methyl ester carboxylesterase|uniref:Alpha/beta hydrolase family protein n=1 Tax=Fadolivirus FV1/VV64 TaxID=3070911 RepID=A0A7D3UW73_9VIRU|nr:alpha/beta hydrolase family protein [Fadolivirus algeromassiliense]QKF94609.1 alpha/beta hydrolase family protein [Fadolivirus FV1/VV64]